MLVMTPGGEQQLQSIRKIETGDDSLDHGEG